MLTRREFATLALSSLAWPQLRAQAQTTGSAIGGVRVGAQTYSFRGLTRPPGGDMVGVLVSAMTDCGIRECELWSPQIEPAGAARDDVRRWRVETPIEHFRTIRKTFESAGITVRAFNYSFNDSFTDQEIERGFEMARALGAEFITASSTLSAAKRVAPFAEKHKMIVAMHNHSNLKDPNEFATPESFAAAMKVSRYFKVNLDIGHFTAANFDAVAYLREHHEGVTNLHIKDRKKNQGENCRGGRATRRFVKCCSCSSKASGRLRRTSSTSTKARVRPSRKSRRATSSCGRRWRSRMRRIGMGLVGPGFVGAHHVDAVRRLGFVDVVAVAASTEASARRKADALGIPRAYGSYEELAADPDVHVVHNTTPNYLHVPVIMAALTHRKHVISDKPLALTPEDARSLWNAAREAGVVHAVTFNYRGNPLVQHAREMVIAGELGEPHFVHGAYLQDWLLKPTDFSWRLEPEKGGKSSAIGDIGSHWCDLVQHVIGQRIEAVLADLNTVITTRFKPATSTEAFAHLRQGSGGQAQASQRGEPFDVKSDDLGTVLVHFSGGARGSVSVGQVCAGHKNDLWFEVNGGRASVRWLQERQNELWIGHRDAANASLLRDPALLHDAARPYAHLPGGHQEAWADAFRNVMKDVYTFIADGRPPDDPKPPAFATFEDGYRSACVVDAILESHAAGSAWTKVRY